MHYEDYGNPVSPVAQGGLGWRAGKVKWAILMWLLGIPLPIILIVLLVRGCAG